VRIFSTPQSRPVSIGNFYGSLKDGILIALDLEHTRGMIKFYWKNGNELWIQTDFSSGNYESKVLTF
jgi:hypothetical protein